MILEYKGKKPEIGKNVFIAPNATVVGDVEIQDSASIWYGTVVRGDREPITISETPTFRTIAPCTPIPGNPSSSVTTLRWDIRLLSTAARSKHSA